MKKILYIFLGALLMISGTAFAVTVFRSDQVGSTPVNGRVLQTNGTNSSWVATSTLGLGGSGTPGGTSGQLQYNASGAFGGVSTTTASCTGTASCTTFTVIGNSPITINATAGAGSGNVSTSTNEIAGRLAYWTSNSATPALLGQVATGTVAAGTGISVTAGQAIIGSGLTITNTGVTSISATAPLVNNLSTGAVSLTCPTCMVAYNPFTAATYSGQTVAATSTGIWLTGSPLSLIASSTFTTNATTTNATSTNLAILSNLMIPFGASVGSNVAGSVVLDTTNDQLKVGDGTTQAIFDQRRFYSFGYATSTTWTGTTTLTIAPIPVAGTFTGVTCTTNVGTLGVDYFYGPVPTHLAYIPTASTTANFFNWTTSNTPGANASSTVSFGTPASAPTSISCTATFLVSGT